jgi:methionyl-tRNA formyltransferase
MRLVMMGTGSFAEPTLEALLASAHQVVGLVTQPDRITGKERGSTRQARRGMKEMAQEHGIPILQPESINTPEGARDLAAWQPDLLVVAAYGQILSKDVLSTAPRGGVNVHASLLPKYRGAAPIAWAIYHGEKATGVTIIRMSTALDAGDILAQEATPIGPQETAGELEARLAPLGARLAVSVIDLIAAGKSKGTPQDKTQATKAPKLTKEHGLIDWTRHAQGVCNQIRAMQPWPTAYTFLHGAKGPLERLLVLRAGVVPDPTLILEGPRAGLVRALPGQLQFIVETGAGDQVEILELQPAGKRRMTAAEFLRGHALQSGCCLGGPTP